MHFRRFRGYHTSMTREEVLSKVRQHSKELDRFFVRSIAVFGSCARDAMQQNSDVDILVEFSRPVGLFHFIRLQNYLEKILQRRVDLVTPEALKPQLRELILSEAVYAG